MPQQLRRWWWLVAFVAIAGCAPGQRPGAAPGRSTAAMQQLDVEAELVHGSAVQAEVRFVNETGSLPLVTVVDGAGRGFSITPHTARPGTETIPVMGLRPDTGYTVTVESGHRTGMATLRTGALPDDFPPIEVTSEPGRMAPGLTLFSAIPFTDPDAAGEDATDDGYLLAVDPEGTVVWYHRQAHSIQDVRRLPDGRLLFITSETGVRRLDPASGTIEEWSGRTGLETVREDAHGRPYAGNVAIPVDTDQMHHEVVELPDGNLMTLSREVRRVAGFPEPICDGDFDGSYDIAADTVVIFRPDSGEVLTEWSLFDYADPRDGVQRIRASEFCGRYLADMYPDVPARDWTHANAAVLDVRRNAVLVSVRHLDQIFAIRYLDDESGPAGDLLWRFGEGGDFTLEEGEWFLHQHAPQVLADGSILLYDNGNERPGTTLEDGDRHPYSRAVRYEIDTEARTARQIAEYLLEEEGPPAYAPFVGDADLLGGTLLITHGGLLDPPAHSPQEPGVLVWGRIVEVEEETGEIVFDLRMEDPTAATGWIIYRAERIPTIYPSGYTVEIKGG